MQPMSCYRLLSLLLMIGLPCLPGAELLSDLGIDGVTHYSVEEIRAALIQDRALARAVEQRLSPAAVERQAAAAIQRGYRRAGFNEAVVSRLQPGRLRVNEGPRRRLRSVIVSGAEIAQQALVDRLACSDQGTPRAVIGEWIKADELCLQAIGREVARAHDEADFADARVVVTVENVDDQNADLVVLCRVPEGRRLHGLRIEGAERNDPQQVAEWLREAADIQDGMLAGGGLLRRVRQVMHDSGRFLAYAVSLEPRSPFDAVDLVLRVAESPLMPLLGEPTPAGVTAVQACVAWLHDGFVAEQQTLALHVTVNDQERFELRLDHLNQLLMRVTTLDQSAQHGLLFSTDNIALWDGQAGTWHQAFADTVAWHKTVDLALETAAIEDEDELGVKARLNAGMSTKKSRQTLLQVTMSPAFAVLMLSRSGVEVRAQEDGSLRIAGDGGWWAHIAEDGRLLSAGGHSSADDGSTIRVMIETVPSAPLSATPMRHGTTAALLASAVGDFARESGADLDRQRLVPLMHGGIKLFERVVQALEQWHQQDDDGAFVIPCVVAANTAMTDIMPMIGVIIEETSDELWASGAWPRTLAYGISAVLGGRSSEIGAAIQGLLAHPDLGPLGATFMVVLGDRFGLQELADHFAVLAQARTDQASFIADLEALSGRRQLVDQVIAIVGLEVWELLLPEAQGGLLRSPEGASPDWRPLARWLWEAMVAEGLQGILDARRQASR